jgi:hypothetical protein
MKRRTFLSRSAGALVGAGLATALPGAVGKVLAAAGARRRFVFVVNQGGWDPLNALTPMFGQTSITMPVASSATTISGLPLVDNAQRPAVRDFFELYARQSVILHGVAVRSVAHDVCQVTMMTGAATGGGAAPYEVQAYIDFFEVRFDVLLDGSLFTFVPGARPYIDVTESYLAKQKK